MQPCPAVGTHLISDVLCFYDVHQQSFLQLRVFPRLMLPTRPSLSLSLTRMLNSLAHSYLFYLSMLWQCYTFTVMQSIWFQLQMMSFSFNSCMLQSCHWLRDHRPTLVLIVTLFTRVSGGWKLWLRCRKICERAISVDGTFTVHPISVNCRFLLSLPRPRPCGSDQYFPSCVQGLK